MPLRSSTAVASLANHPAACGSVWTLRRAPGVRNLQQNHFKQIGSNTYLFSLRDICTIDSISATLTPGTKVPYSDCCCFALSRLPLAYRFSLLQLCSSSICCCRWLIASTIANGILAHHHQLQQQALLSINCAPRAALVMVSTSLSRACHKNVHLFCRLPQQQKHSVMLFIVIPPASFFSSHSSFSALADVKAKMMSFHSQTFKTQPQLLAVVAQAPYRWVFLVLQRISSSVFIISFSTKSIVFCY